MTVFSANYMSWRWLLRGASIRLQLLVFTFFHFHFFYFHLSSSSPTPASCVALPLSLYLNITPYLAGVASRHSNRTVQSPWGLWDIVSCWNRTVRMHLSMCRVYVFPSELNVCTRTCKGSRKIPLIVIGSRMWCNITGSISRSLLITNIQKAIAQSPPKTY